MCVTDRCALPDCAVRRSPQRPAEDPNDPAVRGATDRLASWDIGQLWMAGRKDTTRNREVNRVDGRCEHLDCLSDRFGNVVQLSERANVAYQRCLQGRCLAAGRSRESQPGSRFAFTRRTYPTSAEVRKEPR